MAKAKTKVDSELTLRFERTGNAWLDAGVVGLYRILKGKAPYVDSSGNNPSGTLPNSDEFGLEADHLWLRGSASQIQGYLETAYSILIDTYFNVSSKKQLEEKASWNFYYDSKEDVFKSFPKKKAAGAASLLFDKAARPSGSQVAWASKEPGKLPASHAHLQTRLNEFLQTESLKPGPPAGLLIDGPNQVRPKEQISVGSPDGKQVCFLVGDNAASGVEAKETAFPLLGGSRSFVNGTSNWPRLSWKADLVGKFVPALAFFYRQGDDIYLFFPQANDLRRIDEMAESLKSLVQLEPNLFRNFNFQAALGGYFSRRSEVALAFFHQVAAQLSKANLANRPVNNEANSASNDEVDINDDDESEDEFKLEADISPQTVIEITQKKGPVGFAVVSAAKKGNVWMARDFWTFQDIVYLSRLFERMLRPILHERSGQVFREFPPGTFLRKLIDFDAKDESRTILRDKVCEAILKKEPVLHWIERHVFHISRHTDSTKSKSILPLYRFAKFYEVDLRKGIEMEYDYASMVNVATVLGEEIGREIAAKVLDKEESESKGKARGALFRLRKTRSIGDFMNELARLEFRYEVKIPRAIFDPNVFNPESFEEFRGFCVVAALSRFISVSRTAPAKV